MRLLSRNIPINTTKWYNLQENMKFSKNCEKKQMQNGINIVFSCNKYDNNRMKAFNNINEVDNIKLSMVNKSKKLKIFFAKCFLEAVNIFEQFFMRGFESR